MQAEIGAENLIYVDYHILPPLDGDDTRQRRDAYGVSSTPTVLFDGGRRIVGSNPPPYGRYSEAVEAQRADSSLVLVDVSSTPAGLPGRHTVTVDVQISDLGLLQDPGDYRVKALIYEDGVESRGSVFHHVVRDLVLDRPLAGGRPGGLISFSEEVRLDPSWKEEDLTVVAWIQEGEAGPVENAGLAPLADPTPVLDASWGLIKAGFGPGHRR